MRTLAKWSVEDYHRMIEAGILSDRRVELIEGEFFANHKKIIILLSKKLIGEQLRH